MTTIINLFGAPGSGKSTIAAGLFHAMKTEHYNVELVTEYAKDMVWEERHNVFSDQIYMLGKQNRRLLRLDGKVDYIITDSPILLGICYMVDTAYNNSLERLIVDVFNSYNNVNIFLNRTHSYQELGRNQNEQEANQLAFDIKQLMDKYEIKYCDFNTSDPNVLSGVMSWLNP